MRVLIDDGLSTLVNLTGIGHQTLYLYQSLKKSINCSVTNYFYLKYFPRYIRRFFYIAFSNIRCLWGNYDLIHYQNFYTPLFKGKAKRIVTIHDLCSILFPETLPKVYARYSRSIINKSIRRADAIITPSNSIREEILKYFPNVNPEIIFACEDGIREVFLDYIPNGDILQRFHLNPNRYFFLLGSLSPRKNVGEVIRAFVAAKKNNILSGDTKLVLGGQYWWGDENYQHLLRTENSVLTLGYLEEKTIVELYKYSTALIFPSRYEGFGMPIIEAMSQGTPIIISNISTSIELNKRHNEQMFIFDLGDESGLIRLLEKLENDCSKIKASLNYGDLSMYQREAIAKKHITIYERIIQKE